MRGLRFNRRRQLRRGGKILCLFGKSFADVVGSKFRNPFLFFGGTRFEYCVRIRGQLDCFCCVRQIRHGEFINRDL